jgi:BASS family bile acid:Na+ symporter
MKEADARTVAIEVGLQNAGLASGIAKGLGKIATIGLAAGVFGPIMNITGSMLASYWHKQSPDQLK